MKQSKLLFLLVVLLSMTSYNSYAYDFAVKNVDGKTIYYKWNSSKTSLVVTFSGSDIYSKSYRGSITIPESVEYDGNTYSVTHIGMGAFYGCDYLSSVTIPNSVTTIDEKAFEGCSYLSSVTIPNSVTSIGNQAFKDCSALSSITIPNSVVSIGYGAYSGCSSLKSIIIPNNVTSIENGTFSGCSSLMSVVIPNSVTSIGYGAFDGCIRLGSMTLPYSVTSIDYSAFAGCSSLTSLTIPNTTTFHGNPFYGCEKLNLINVIITDLSTFDIKIINWFRRQVSSSAIFSLLDNEGNEITEYVIPDGVTSIEDFSFYNCRNLCSVTIPNSVVSIGACVFQGCGSLSSITIPNSVQSINSDALKGCQSGLNLVITDPSKFDNKIISLLGTSIGGSVTLLDNEGNEITEYVIPDGVKSIDEYAFYLCSGLMSVTIPNSVTSIGRYAFCNCSNLSSIVIGSGVTSIVKDAFLFANLKKTIWLTNTPPSGYNYAAGNVNYVSNDQFSFDNKVIYQFLSSYFDVDGIRYVPVSPSEKTCDAIDCTYNERFADINIASTVMYKGVTMSVKNIKSFLAYNNKYIKTLNVDNDGELSNYAFAYCSNMQSVSLGQKVSAIGAHAFSGCPLIETIDIPDIVTELNDYTFSDCTSLKEIKIKPKMTNIKNYVFDKCTSLKNVFIENSDNELIFGANKVYDWYSTYIGTPLFSDCPLDSVYIGRNISYGISKNYGYSPFYCNTSLRAVKITDKETEISENEFYGCTNLQRVIIGDGLTSIGDRAFSGCSSLKYFAFGSKVQDIGQEAFSDCTALTEISSNAYTPPVCGSQALDDINKWECKLIVPKDRSSVYQNAEQWKDFFFMEEAEPSYSFIAGDANGDGEVDSRDINAIVDYIMIGKTEGFIFNNADMNGDQKVNVADIVQILNIIKVQ